MLFILQCYYIFYKVLHDTDEKWSSVLVPLLVFLFILNFLIIILVLGFCCCLAVVTNDIRSMLIFICLVLISTVPAITYAVLNIDNLLKEEKSKKKLKIEYRVRMAVILVWNSALFIIMCLGNLRFKITRVATTSKTYLGLPENNQNGEIVEERDWNEIGKRFVSENIPISFGNTSAVNGQNEGDQEYNKETCIICFNSRTNALFKPCNHGGVCSECSIICYESKKKCPICRKDINHIVIYQKTGDGRLQQTEQYPDQVIL